MREAGLGYTPGATKAASVTLSLVSGTDNDKADLIAVPLPEALRTAVLAELKVARHQLDKLIARVEAMEVSS
jgi:cobalamin biosynthesis protein CbiD